MLNRPFLLAGALAIVAVGTLGAQEARLAATPARPAPGAFVWLTLSDSAIDPSRTVSGVMAGEPLHFAADSNGRWRALGAVPIDASGNITARAFVARADGVDTVQLRIAVPEIQTAAASRLSVAPRFSAPMDAATAARVRDENARARAVGRRAHETPRLWTGPFVRPRASVITSQFGTGRVFNGAVTSRHLGVDFRGEVGAEVYATNRGVVALVDTFFLAGRLIYLDHGAGVTTAYFHLSETLVAVGDTVQPGQLIGRVGDSGRVTAPHLHWAARYGSLSVNPLDLVALTAPSTSAPQRPRTPSSSSPAPPSASPAPRSPLPR